MTQAELASAIGVTFQQIQKYESGGCMISAPRLWLISRALGVPTDYFFAGLSRVDPAERA
jgi:transcriptional regulator with XRE-family HTH domain